MTATTTTSTATETSKMQMQIKHIDHVKCFIDCCAYHNIVLGFTQYGLTPFSNYVAAVKFKHKKGCNICCNKKNHFKKCYRCSAEYCSKCFYTNTKKGLTCLYCRYTFYEHFKYYSELLNDCSIMRNIEQLNNI